MIWDIAIFKERWERDEVATAARVVEMIGELAARGFAGADGMDYVDAGFEVTRLTPGDDVIDLLEASEIDWGEGERIETEATHAFELASGDGALTVVVEAVFGEEGGAWLAARLSLELAEQVPDEAEGEQARIERAEQALSVLIEAYEPDWGGIIEPNLEPFELRGARPLASWCTYLGSRWSRMELSPPAAVRPFAKGQLLVAYPGPETSEASARTTAVEHVQQAIDRVIKEQREQAHDEQERREQERARSQAQAAATARRSTLEPNAMLAGTAPLRRPPQSKPLPFKKSSPAAKPTASKLEPHPQLGATSMAAPQSGEQALPFSAQPPSSSAHSPPSSAYSPPSSAHSPPSSGHSPPSAAHSPPSSAKAHSPPSSAHSPSSAQAQSARDTSERPPRRRSLEPNAMLGSTAAAKPTPSSRALPFEQQAAKPKPKASKLEPHSQLGSTQIASAAHAPKQTAPQLTLEQYASMSAEVALWPERQQAIWQRYGLASEQEAQRLRHTFDEQFRRDPEARARFQKRLAEYRAWLESKKT